MTLAQTELKNEYLRKEELVQKYQPSSTPSLYIASSGSSSGTSGYYYGVAFTTKRIVKNPGSVYDTNGNLVTATNLDANTNYAKMVQHSSGGVSFYNGSWTDDDNIHVLGAALGPSGGAWRLNTSYASYKNISTIYTQAEYEELELVQKDIKRVTIRPNGTEKQIRPAGGWTPGANTIAYYPLTDNFNDYSGNGYNLTQNSAQIATLNGVKCCDLNSSYCSANFVINTLPCTMAFRHKSKVTTNNFLAICFADSTRNWGGRGIGTWNANELQVRYGNPTNTYSLVSYTFNTNWNLYVLTLSNAKGTLYINSDTYQLKTSLSAPSGSGSPLRIGANEVGQTGWGQGYMSQIIVENKARTAQEVADYYNQTKGNYGIQALNNSLNNTFTPTITPDIPDTPGSGTGDILTI